MTITRLCSAAELGIQNMHLTQEEEQTVRSIVQRYAYPQSCCQIICWGIYRIQQAIKSLFGHSDWRAAETVIKKRLLCIAMERGVIQQNLPNHLQAQLEETITELCVNRIVPSVSTDLLEITVLCQECATDVEERIRDTLQQLDFISLMNDLQARFAPIRASLEPRENLRARLDALVREFAPGDAERQAAPAA